MSTLRVVSITSGPVDGLDATPVCSVNQKRAEAR
jgi:hypothetical protein